MSITLSRWMENTLGSKCITCTNVYVYICIHISMYTYIYVDLFIYVLILICAWAFVIALPYIIPVYILKNRFRICNIK